MSIIDILLCLEKVVSCFRLILHGMYSVGLKAICQYGRLPTIPLVLVQGLNSQVVVLQPNVAIKSSNVSLSFSSDVVNTILLCLWSTYPSVSISPARSSNLCLWLAVKYSSGICFSVFRVAKHIPYFCKPL